MARSATQGEILATTLSQLHGRLYAPATREVVGSDALAVAYILEGARSDNLATTTTRQGTDINDIVRSTHHILVVLHNDNRVTRIAQALKARDKAVVIPLVQADAWLIEDVEDIHEFRAYLRSEAYTLCLTTRYGARSTRQRQVAEAHIYQEAYTLAYLLNDVAGDGTLLRYISHLDYAGVMERAIRRAKLPAAYSEGFNPHIKMAFASALSLGVVSEAEYMDFELTRPLCQPEVFEKLSQALPEGVKLLRLKPVREPKPCKGKKHKALMAEVEEAEYELLLPMAEGAGWDGAVNAVKAYNEAKEAFVHRVTPKTDKQIETKQYMLQPVKLSMAGDLLKLNMDIAITQTGSVKPGEVLELLVKEYGLPGILGRVLIRRTAMKGQGKPLIELV